MDLLWTKLVRVGTAVLYSTHFSGKLSVTTGWRLTPEKSMLTQLFRLFFLSHLLHTQLNSELVPILQLSDKDHSWRKLAKRERTQTLRLAPPPLPLLLDRPPSYLYSAAWSTLKRNCERSCRATNTMSRRSVANSWTWTLPSSLASRAWAEVGKTHLYAS